MAHRVLHSSWSQRTRCGINKVREGAAITAAEKEACKTSWNLIDAGKPAPQASPSSCVPVPLYALSSFSSTTSLIYYAAQSNSSARLFSTLSSIIRDKKLLTTARTQLDIDRKQLVECFAVACLKELHADNEARGAAVRLAGLISPSFWSHQDSHRGAREQVQSCRRTDITASGSKWFLG